MVSEKPTFEQELEEIEEELRSLTLRVRNIRARRSSRAPAGTTSQPRVGDEVVILVNRRPTRGTVVGETAERLKVKIPGSILPVQRAHKNVNKVGNERS